MGIYDSMTARSRSLRIIPSTVSDWLAELRFGIPAFHLAEAGILTARPILKTSDATATGTASWFRCVSKAGVAVVDGSVGRNGEPAGAEYDLDMDSPKIQEHSEVAINAFSYQV